MNPKPPSEAGAVVADPDLAVPAALPAHWNRLLDPYRGPSTARSLTQLLLTSLLFVGMWWAMAWSLDVSYWLTLVLAVPTAGLTVRLFIFLHDCAHGSFFHSATGNKLTGRILGVLTLTPFRYWQRTHVLHHATSGNLDRRGFGDIDTVTVAEYQAMTPFGRWRYRMVRNPFVFLAIGPAYLYLLKHRLPLDLPRAWKKEWSSVWWNNLALAAVLVVMALTMGFGRFVSVQAPVFLLSTMFGIGLFYVQHQYANTYWRREKDWDFAEACLQGSSYLQLPQPLRWFSGDIGVHHIHHLCSAIPNYRLKACMDEVPDLPPPRRLGFRDCLHSLRLSLWDEASQKLVSFRSPAVRGQGS